jgi:hypothetical protein
MLAGPVRFVPCRARARQGIDDVNHDGTLAVMLVQQGRWTLSSRLVTLVGSLIGAMVHDPAVAPGAGGLLMAMPHMLHETEPDPSAGLFGDVAWFDADVWGWCRRDQACEQGSPSASRSGSGLVLHDVVPDSG